MKKSYWFYLLDLWKSLSCIGVIFGCLISFSIWQKGEKLTLWDISSGALEFAIISNLFFLIPLLLLSFIRWFLQKNIILVILSFFLNYMIFFGYGYELIIGINKRSIENRGLSYPISTAHNNKLIISMIIATFLFLLLSEYFIQRRKQHM